MAPEVYLSKPYGSAVDIYSLGLVLYKFMNDNRLPFLPPAPNPITFADRENALSRRMKGEILPPPAKASKEFADIILKACAYKPEERYRTAADMLEDIKELKIKPDAPVQNPGPNEETKTVTNSFFPSDNEENAGTVGLWDIPSISVEENTISPETEDILPEDESILSKNNDSLSENKNMESDGFPGEVSVLPENSNVTALEPESINAPTDEQNIATGSKKTSFMKKWLIPLVAVVAVTSACVGKYIAQTQHEQQVQESIAALEQEYATKMNAINSLIETTDYEQAIQKCQEAIQLDSSQEDAYKTLVQCYLLQNNVEEAQKFLQSESVINHLDDTFKNNLIYSCHMQKISDLLSQGDYHGIKQYCKNENLNSIETLTIYYQNGMISDLTDFNLSFPVLKFYSSQRIIIIYYGNVHSNGLKNGLGKEIKLFFDTGNYYVSDGVNQWSSTY